MKKATPQLKIRAALMRKGYTIESWSKEHGFNTSTVGMALIRWAGKSGIPRGDKTRQVLSRLETTLGKPIYTKID